jgi:hypothetical protein
VSDALAFGKVPLDYVREFFCRYVVVESQQADAIAIWIAHTYVFETSRATPYLHFCSPEWGSGKTTALDVIAELAARAISIDDISGAALFRLIEADSPTVLLDEVDGVFGKKSSDVAEDHRKLLNSGYRKGKQAIRCGGRNNTELQRFNIFCPKALAGLNELPGTLAHRAIPIAMKPPARRRATRISTPRRSTRKRLRSASIFTNGPSAQRTLYWIRASSPPSSPGSTHAGTRSGACSSASPTWPAAAGRKPRETPPAP